MIEKSFSERHTEAWSQANGYVYADREWLNGQINRLPKAQRQTTRQTYTERFKACWEQAKADGMPEVKQENYARREANTWLREGIESGGIGEPAKPAPDVQCTRCRNKHAESERIETAPDRNGMRTMVCPRCGGHSYYKLERVSL